MRVYAISFQGIVNVCDWSKTHYLAFLLKKYIVHLAGQMVHEIQKMYKYVWDHMDT